MQTPPHGSHTVSTADFGRMRMLDELAAASHSNADLAALAMAMIGSSGDVPKDGPDDEENPFTPAGYTYLGQFVDHDLTFDTHSNFDDPTSFGRASNMRTPRFDLDNVYGRGPDDQPYLYNDPFDGTLLLGDKLANGVKDVPRNKQGRAIIGDPRNDENSIVVQLQSAFIRFHNKLVGRAKALGHDTKDAFSWAQTQTRKHYQRILLDDFLPRIIDPTASTVQHIIADLGKGKRPILRLYDLARPPYMPVEFSVAAYRFGHSMIRPGYRLSAAAGDVPLSQADDVRLFAIFHGASGGLRGFQKLDRGRGIDWSLFFSKSLVAGSLADNADGSANNSKGVKRLQLGYKIDTSVVSPIGSLPPKIASDPSSLAERNLKRGRDFGLPSGQAVADRIGATKLTDSQITVRGANGPRQAITSISAHFTNNTPLWLYILAEAEQALLTAGPGQSLATMGTRLGEVGGAIVLETFVGIMLNDPESVLNSQTGWRSINNKPTFSMAELFAEIGTPLS